MYRPFSATLLSLFLAFSAPLFCFPAQSVAKEPDLLFVTLKKPVRLPDAIVHCPNQRPSSLATLLKQKAKGRQLLLHFWAPSCAPCQEEMKQLDIVSAHLEKQNVALFVLAQDAQAAVTVPTFARRHGIISLDLCYDQSRTSLMSLKPEGLPVTYLVSPTGQIVAFHEGPVDWMALKD